MSDSEKPLEHFDELGRLLSLLCEGELSAQELSRLRELLTRSHHARRYFLEYLQLHGELHWAAGMGRETETATPVLRPECPVGMPWSSPLGARVRTLLWQRRRLLAAVALLAAIAIGFGVVFVRTAWRHHGGSPAPTPTGSVARWGQTSLPQWGLSSAKPETSSELKPGQIVELQSGYAELVFPDHTRLILEGPSRLSFLGPRKVEFQLGRLSVYIPEDVENTFFVQTPAGVIYGGPHEYSFKREGEPQPPTFFGVAVSSSGITYVHIFYGHVSATHREDQQAMEACWDGVRIRTTRPRSLPAGSVVKLIPAGDPPYCKLSEGDVPLDVISFTSRLPTEAWAERLEGFRAAVAKHPQLIHHYTFEGQTPAERRRDKRGHLHLMEVVMKGGRAERSAQFVLAPAGAKQWAFAPSRSIYGAMGNARGEALQSEEIFVPPPQITLELLVNFAPFPYPELSGDCKGVLLAAGAERGQCPLLLAVDCWGRILHWFPTETVEDNHLERFSHARPASVFSQFTRNPQADFFIPGEWYYLASTFQTDPQKQTTLVNIYRANLTQEEKTLQWIVKNQQFEGLPAASRLAIGKGFDSQGRHAYPWSGLIDEIAIYATVLDRQTLQEHLELLIKSQPSP